MDLREKISHVSVINWVRWAANEICKMRAFSNRETNILKLDSICVNFKKN